jgi:hypothetical protein
MSIPPEACSRWAHCSVNVCPLDPDATKRKHIAGETVCPQLLESVKKDGAATLARFEGQPVTEAVIHALPAIRSTFPRISRALELASTSGSRKLAALARFAPAPAQG